MAIDDNTSYELTGYQVKDLAGRIRRKAEASSVPTSISDLGKVTANDIDWSTFVQIGTAQVEYQANSTAGGFVSVTFDTPFTHAPVVFAQDLLGNGDVSSLTVSNVTTTGFRLLARCMRSSSSGTATVNWIAFSPQG